MNVGDKVKWSSQSSGSTKIKEGIIYAVVPARYPSRDYLPDKLPLSQRKFDNIFTTEYERYIIAVPRGGVHWATGVFKPENIVKE